MAVLTTYFRSRQLPCFSTIHHALKPFFKQWHIHALDIIRILDFTYAEARQEMAALRSFYGKSKNEAITVDEFCAYTRLSKKIVRMYLVSRVMEGELKRQVGKVNLKKAVGSGQ